MHRGYFSPSCNDPFTGDSVRAIRQLLTAFTLSLGVRELPAKTGHAARGRPKNQAIGRLARMLHNSAKAESLSGNVFSVKDLKS